MTRTVFILQIEQQEKEPERVKLVTPAICLLYAAEECIQTYQWFDHPLHPRLPYILPIFICSP